MHPVPQAVDLIGDVLKGAADVPVEFLSPTERADLLVRLPSLADALLALHGRVAAASDDIALDSGHRNIASWLADKTRSDYGPALRHVRLSEAVAGRWQAVGEALSHGEVSTAQAEVIVTGLQQLPADIDAATVQRAESTLLGYAAKFPPKKLRTLAGRILDIVAPEVGEAHEARVLESQEQRAFAKAAVFSQRRGDGTTRIQITAPDAIADHFLACLEGYASPRRNSEPTTTGERQPHFRRLGQAFCQLIENLNPANLPQQGGDATRLVVTISLDHLTTGLGSAQLATGGTISASEARRLACNAGIIPAVLGSKSEVLDLGRTARLFNAPQRKALRIQHSECEADGCTIPAAWCEAHHEEPWQYGGRTDLAMGRLLCSWHHHRAHDSRYVMKTKPGGGLTFHRRP